MIWVVLALPAVVVFLLLALLGVMRETVLLRGEVKAFQDLIRRPPPPKFVNGHMPEALTRALAPRLPFAPGSHQLLVAFVSPGCAPCEETVDALAAAVADGRVRHEDLAFVVWVLDETEGELFSPRIPGAFVLDSTGELSRACEVRATPTLFLVERDSYRVLDYSLEGTPQWATSRLATDNLVATAT